MEDSNRCCCSLIDLPKSFLSQLLSLCNDDETKHALLCVSKSAFDTITELAPAAACKQGSHPTAQQLQQLLCMGRGLQALLLPDSANDVELSEELQLQGLQTVVLNYRCVLCAVVCHATADCSRAWRYAAMVSGTAHIVLCCC